ncbi:cytochrome p450 [Moniliophthora roreri MCA 2997]|uniref:Cytochrome p450 n=1 Tax=Moniliophthora roreri (strain MCA 2997) TaxID=1381753 RepID=V2WUY4_MONRO|nr:cytochrome p450 [Moniliophthora roreri MCA 2997]
MFSFGSWLNITSTDRILALLLGCFVVFLAARIFLSRSYSDVASVPGPGGGHWLWGHEREIFLNPAGSKFSEWFEKYGHVVRYKGAMAHQDLLVVADPRFIHHMLTDNPYNYVKSPVFRPLVERLLGRGLIWAEHDEHRQQRKVLNPAFSPANLRARLESTLQENGGSITTNIMKWTAIATLDIIGRVGFNHDFKGGETQEAKDIQKAWTDQVNAGMETAAFYAQIFLRTFPFLLYIPVDAIQKQGDIKMVINRLAEMFLKRGADVEKGRNLLSLMVKANSQGDGKMSNQQMIDHITTFVIVGHETTAGSLNMTLLELARNRACQQKLRDEVLGLGREPTYEDLTNPDVLPYLDAVIKEGLRLHPPGAYMDRVAVKDDVVPLSTPITTPSGEVLHSLRIRAGQFIQIPNISINRVNSAWKDGQVFRPERWIEPGGLPPRSEMQGGWSNIMSFSEGPRLCIGYRLALLEYKCILAMLIRNFEFWDTGAEIETKFSATMQPRVVGKEAEGAQLPLKVTLVEN